jgi:hypothetical protein
MDGVVREIVGKTWVGCALGVPKLGDYCARAVAGIVHEFVEGRMLRIE